MASEIQKDSTVVTFALTPADMARSYRGRRFELRRAYEKEEDSVRKVFLEKALVQHTELMIRNNRPVHSMLWEAEKDGNKVHLFGDVHKVIWKPADFSPFNLAEDDTTCLFQSFIHPDVWTRFENSDRFYVELFNFKHVTELKEISAQLQVQYPFGVYLEPLCDLYAVPWYEHRGSFGIGLVECLLIAKAGTKTTIQEMDSKLDSFVVEMESIAIQKDAMELCCRLGCEHKEMSSNEHLFEILDAIQMGNLESLVPCLDEKISSEIKANLESRNPGMTSHVLNSLKRGEKALFAPGISHLLGNKGMIRLLEAEGVQVRRIELH